MKNGDFIEIEYTGRIQGSNEIFDLTSEKLAKENGIFNPRVKYGPVKIIIGGEMLLKPLDTALVSIGIGEEKDILINRKEGFGERNLNLKRTMPLKNLQKQNI